MIWDFIRDFLVQYIFGGCDSNDNVYGGFLGRFNYAKNGEFFDELVNENTATLSVPIGDVYSQGEGDIVTGYIQLGDWLSTTATIIIMCAIVFAFALLVRWVFKSVTSAFLLR